MPRSTPILAVGGFLVLLGAGLFALTLIKAKPGPANPTKAQLREQAALSVENKKMRLGAGIVAGIGVAVMLIS